MKLPQGPFRTSDSPAYGVTPGVIRGPRFVRLARGVVMTAPDETVSITDRVTAARLVLPTDAVVIGLTGLRLRGIDVGPDAPLRFASRHRHLVRRTGIAVRRVTRLPALGQAEPAVATIAHCFVAASLDLDLVDLVAAGDWLYRRKLITRDRLLAQLAASSDRGVVRARRAASLTVADQVDSPQETRLRLCLVLAGLPTPRCNRTLGTADRPIGRVDMDYEQYQLILEYEGDQHRVDRKQWNVDIDRFDEFTAEGYLIQRITAERMHRPRAVVLAAYTALRNRGYQGPEPVFTDEWCRLFERRLRTVQ